MDAQFIDEDDEDDDFSAPASVNLDRKKAKLLAALAAELIASGHPVTRVSPAMIRDDAGKSVFRTSVRAARIKGGRNGAQAVATTNRMARLGDHAA